LQGPSGTLLFDSPGLGKTIQAIALILANSRSPGAFLIHEQLHKLDMQRRKQHHNYGSALQLPRACAGRAHIDNITASFDSVQLMGVTLAQQRTPHIKHSGGDVMPLDACQQVALPMNACS
jgi:hypothetical protein